MFELAVYTCLNYTLKAKREREISQKAVYKIVPRTTLICGMFLSRDLLDYLF